MAGGSTWRILRGLAVVSLLLVATPIVPVGADDGHEQTMVTGSHERAQFAAAPRVRVHDARLGDLFTAGGEVAMQRTEAEDVYAAGGSVRCRDTVVVDLVAAGGDLAIDCEAKDDVLAAAGRLRLDSRSVVGGDLIAAAAEMDLSGRIAGNVTAAGGRIVISGTIGGDVELAAGEVVVDPGARVSGRLLYRSDEVARISPQAIIGGGVERVETTASHFPVAAGIGVAIALLAIVALGTILLGAALQGALPRPLHAAMCVLLTQPGLSWLIGFALVVAVPIAANILILTVLGIPTGVVLYAAYMLGLAAGIVTAGYGIGSWLVTRSRAAQTMPPAMPLIQARILRTALGILLLVVIGLVPFVGWLALLLAIPSGVGAFAREGLRSLQALPPAPDTIAHPHDIM